MFDEPPAVIGEGRFIRPGYMEELDSIEESVKELKWAKQNGAVGVFFRGMEGNLTLDNPHFFPVYQTAMDLDLPICIHTGSGTPAVTAMFDLERNRRTSILTMCSLWM